MALGYLGRYCSNLRAIGSLKIAYMSSISDGEGEGRRHAARHEWLTLGLPLVVALSRPERVLTTLASHRMLRRGRIVARIGGKRIVGDEGERQERVRIKARACAAYVWRPRECSHGNHVVGFVRVFDSAQDVVETAWSTRTRAQSISWIHGIFSFAIRASHLSLTRRPHTPRQRASELTS